MANLFMRFLPDEPINSGDLLGFDEFVDLIHNAIQQTQTPFVYGVLGDWGVGKTSILRLLQARFEFSLTQLQQRELYKSHEYHVPIWFNAWKYENETNIIYPLLHAIETDYKQRLKLNSTIGTGFGKQLGRIAKISALVVTDAALRAVTRPLLGDEQALDLDAVRQALDDVLQDEKASIAEHILSSWANLVDELETAFTDLLEQYAHDLSEAGIVSASKIRFVIIIDDLDRCLPDTTIKLLESIKNHFAVKSPAIFILGLNAQVVYQGIRHKFGQVEINGREYLEKILNYTFYVPQPEPERVLDFAGASLTRLTNNDPVWEQFANHFEEFGKILSTARFTNPRKIKRILNRFLLFISKYYEHQQNLNDYNIGNVIRLLIISEYYPTVFQLLLNGTYDPLERPAEQIGAHNFSIDDFESKYGISIQAIYPQLAQHQNLFTGLKKRETAREFDLPGHVQAVYTISRII
jgi:hypothetical protein